MIIIGIYQLNLSSIDKTIASFIPKHTDMLLDIQLRQVSHSILDDYANYIIATLSALHEGLDEVRFFMHNTRFRSRTFQLYIMQECLFHPFIPCMNQNEYKLYYLLFSKIKNRVDIFYDEKKLNKVADHEELQIMHELIQPRIQLMFEEAKHHSDIFTLRTQSYHVIDQLELIIGKNRYEQLKEKIKQFYLEYE